ncbi:MAG: thioredoxin family protein [Ferruginibacter sp.]
MINKSIIPVLAIAIGLLSFTKPTNDPIAIGADMPGAEVSLKSVSGKNINLKNSAQKNGILIMFSCNTCPYVIKNQKRTAEICAYALKNNIGVVVINSNEALRNGDDSYDEMVAYAKEQGYQWDYVVDENSALANAFGANRTPESFLFNNNLKLVYHGAIDDSPADETAITRAHLQIAINELTAGKDITINKSRSVGCTIKRKN